LTLINLKQLYFRDEIETKSNLYGKNPAGFDYSEAPERGWQKDKRDFTYQGMQSLCSC